MELPSCLLVVILAFKCMIVVYMFLYWYEKVGMNSKDYLMGKKQHSKDRLFITRSEWKNEFGGKKEERE